MTFQHKGTEMKFVGRNPVNPENPVNPVYSGIERKGFPHEENAFS
jgi:hypothetical protein